MVKKIEVEGYEALYESLKENTGTVFVLFSGSLDENGVSWCPDCVKGKTTAKNLYKGNFAYNAFKTFTDVGNILTIIENQTHLLYVSTETLRRSFIETSQIFKLSHGNWILHWL